MIIFYIFGVQCLYLHFWKATLSDVIHVFDNYESYESYVRNS
jgi:hypothetical protein